jgi:acyl-CoA synthetase (NDP forming)
MMKRGLGDAVRRGEPDLSKLFRPKTLAVVGATDAPESSTRMAYDRLERWCDDHDVVLYPVNPRRETVRGRACYPTLADIPDEVDVVTVFVADARDAVRAAVDKGAAFVVVFAAGYSETGEDGAARERELVEIVRGTKTRLLGPNTALNAFEWFKDLPGRPIALITQSGAQGRPLFQAQDIGIALSHWAPVGNEADLDTSDFVRFFSSEPETGAIAAYVEGFKSGRAFIAAARSAAERRVPIVLVKVGRTNVGASWTQTHTGHVAGNDAVFSAMCRQFGVTRVDELDELVDVAQLFARAHPIQGRGICVYTTSGGTSSLFGDMAAAAGLRMPELAPTTVDKLRQWIPDMFRISNPIDSGGVPASDWRGPLILETILADPNVDVLVVPVAGWYPPTSDVLAADVVAAAQRTDKTVCVIWNSPVADEPSYREVLLGANIPVFRSYRNCIMALSAYFEYNDHLDRLAAVPALAVPSRRSRPAIAARRLVHQRTGTLSERDSKEILAAYRITTSRDVFCQTMSEAVAAAREIGFPVVVKASAELAHKSDHGLVRVGLNSAREVRFATKGILAAAEQLVPGGVEGVLVSELVRGGVETVVGVACDETFGPVVMFGLGGVAVELFHDVSFRIPPFDDVEARRMVAETRAATLLAGYRTQPAVDTDALVDVIIKLSRLALDLEGEIREVDINPLIVRPDGAVAVDALVALADRPSRRRGQTSSSQSTRSP